MGKSHRDGRATAEGRGPARPRSLARAPGRPGAPARWCSGSKMAGGTTLSPSVLLWFTVGRGAVEEVYFPRIDSPCTRNLFLMVTGPDGLFADERTDTAQEVAWLDDGVPGFVLTNTCRRGSFRIEKTVLVDDVQNVLLQETRFVPLIGSPSGWRVFVCLNPHLAGKGEDNTGWVGDFKGTTMLFAQRGETALALACSRPLRAASAGYVGASDGVDDLRRHGRLTRTYARATRGNVGLIAEVDAEGGAEFLVSLGFGLGAAEAANHARAGLQRDPDEARARYLARWRAWQGSLRPPDPNPPGARDLYRASAATLMVHTNKSVPGAVASMAIPWGDHRGDDDLMKGAYHLVWPRDLAQTGGALLALGAFEEARRLLHYLAITQEGDGRWPQNMWVDGRAFWDGLQMDQVAQPILLADLALRLGALGPGDRDRLGGMIRLASDFLLARGAATDLDRWEEQRGYTPYTLGATIAALRTAADWALAEGRPDRAAELRATADAWDGLIEGWLYVTDTPLARRLEIEGYYARILPPEAIESPEPGQGRVRPVGPAPEIDGLPATEVVSVDALALVRFGLRAPDDPRIRNTVRAIDALLRLDTPRGPIWHRYNGDRFGERADGGPYEAGEGIGRAWPLLVGERAHYELARGDRAEAERLLGAMAAFASEAGMISEQVWDAPDLPERGLGLGRPTGSVMPLLWAHAEYLKLRRSLGDGAVFDLPPRPAARSLPGARP